MKRALGPEELKYWFLDRVQPFNVVAGARLSCKFEPDAIREKIKEFQSTQILCRVCIQSDQRPRYVLRDDAAIDLQVVEIKDASGRLAYIESELARPFSVSQGPLVRIGLIVEPETGGSSVTTGKAVELFLTLHHAICDGIGAAAMLDDLLMLLGCGQGKRRIASPSFEELIPEELFGSDDSVARRDRWWSRQVGEGLAMMDWEGLQSRMKPVGRTRLCESYLDHSLVDSLVDRCRSEGTTVHGAITAAAILGLESTLPHQRKITHSVSLRDRWDPPCGYAPSLCLSRVVVDSLGHQAHDFWEIAKSNKEQLEKAIRNGDPYDFALDAARSLEPGAGELDRDQSDLTISNPGRLRLKSCYGAIRIERVFIAGSVVVNSPVISTSTGGTGMTIFLCYPETWEYAAESERCLNQIVETLRGACV